ncbi:MAG TPA: hypothetical protein VEV81_11945 [Pyrinomonadaceae bacterium]|nr:hypothetical protein [Pyrinomonadaceae bacterium]
MKPNKTIRVIKSAERGGGDRGGQNINTESSAPEAKDARQPSTGVTSQVASWVKEFQQRRRPDPRRAFASLFADTVAPLNSLS